MSFSSSASRTKRVKNARIHWLGDEIICSFGEQGKGLPLGNLTSQWFGNIYLDGLDQYITKTLRVRRYIRYNDDMIVVGECESDVWKWVACICAFVTEQLHLEIPRDKISVARLPTPVDILGVVTDGARQWTRTATRVRAEKRLRKRTRALHPKLLDSQCSYASIGVYV